MPVIRYHLIAFVLGMALDAMIGDPPKLPHPVRLIGSFISFLEGRLLRFPGEVPPQVRSEEMSSKSMDLEAQPQRREGAEKRAGGLMVVIVVLSTITVTAAVMAMSYLIHPIAGVIVETILTAYTMAAKDLTTESMKVHARLVDNDLSGARRELSMIVGRDTEVLDEEGVIRAAVETVAENTCDGVAAPMMFDAIGTPILGMTYKAINTMDSMVGYRNIRYENFGYFAAKLDDVVNYIPARLAAVLMIISCMIMGPDYNTSKAIEIYKRDRKKSESPNAGHTESVAAGALGVTLAGDAVYFGRKKHKPLIGDATKKITAEDISKVNKLMQTAAVLELIICITVLLNI